MAKAIITNLSGIEKLKREGKLKEYANVDELQRARERRKKAGKTDTPVYLLPDDHFRTRKRHTITMAKEAHAIAKKIGNGNVSGGIERALLHWLECPRTDRRKAKGRGK